MSSHINQLQQETLYKGPFRFERLLASATSVASCAVRGINVVKLDVGIRKMS